MVTSKNNKQMKKKVKANLRPVRVRLSNGAGFSVKWSLPNSVKFSYEPLTDSINHPFWKKS